MKYKIILLSSFFFPALLMAQTPQKPTEEVVDSLNDVDMSLVGIVDATMTDGGDEAAQQEISSTVVLQNDIFLKETAYQLSPAYFKVRGYENSFQKKYINGVEFNDQYRGVFNYSSIGALNDVTRNGDVSNYTLPSSFSFGSLGGAENILMKAGDYAKGGKITLSYTNRNYYARALGTYSTGLMSNGWAFTFGVGARYSDEGSVDGTFYRNIAYALMAEKRWKNHSLSLVTFGSPVQRGQMGGSIQEVYDLVGDNRYNPNWGYQNGEKRNSRVVTSFDPTTIFSHKWNISDKVLLTTGLGLHYSYYGKTALNWYNAPDPRPDYYRYLPSYFDDEAMASRVANMWKSANTAYTQINWDKLYEANITNRESGDGSALYMVEERRSDLYEGTFNSTLNAEISDHSSVTAGVGLRGTQSQQFKTADDLLGAEYVLDIDKYAERDFAGDYAKMQSDLNHPDRKVYKDGIFGYNYNLNIMTAKAWVVNNFKYSHLEGYYGLNYKYTQFQRDGKMRNGRYPDDSYGKGEKHRFNDMQLKAGLVYKISGSHFLTANLSYGTNAPIVYNAYVQPRISDKTVDLESGRVFSADLGYSFSTPWLKGRVSVFQTNFYDQTESSSYYHDYMATFIHHTLTGVKRVNRGIEIGANIKVNDALNFDLAGSMGEYYYDNNPMGYINSENGKYNNEAEMVYMKNLHVAGTPQCAGTIGVNYFIDYWFLGANINGFGRNYIDPAPGRRLASIYAEVDPTDQDQLAAFNAYTQQERFDPDFTVDLSIGKIIYLPGKESINFNLSVNNILNNKDIKTGGYEQGRFDLTHSKRFKNKYFYMQGLNCYLNVSYRF